MTKFTFRNAVAAMAVLVTLSSLAFGDIRIRFARGRSSATVSGRIAAGGRICFRARAKAGQTVDAAVSSDTVKVMFLESADAVYNFQVERTGDQSVCIDNIGSATRYKFEISIE